MLGLSKSVSCRPLCPPGADLVAGMDGLLDNSLLHLEAMDNVEDDCS